MQKFTQLFEKKITDSNGVFDKQRIENLLKTHNEIDLITDKGERFFITPFMHQKGKLSKASDVAVAALTKGGKQIEVLYSDIKTIEY
jgi:uncharacterized protein with ATP-grasp and redox domains